uniref:Uncharacterized protein n=1 Tax=Panagrolaimus sp. JU765 TaxID=591449 RepID=A0AC34PXZ2_9BILA
MDANVLDHANVYLLNKLEPSKAVELAVIVDSEFGKVSDMVQAIENWVSRQDPDTRITFYRWIEDVKRQSEIVKNIFESKTSEFNLEVVQVFRKALKSFYRTDISQSEQSDFYRELYHNLELDQQKQLDQLYYQIYERAKFHFLTPNLDFDKYQRIMIAQNDQNADSLE